MTPATDFFLIITDFGDASAYGPQTLEGPLLRNAGEVIAELNSHLFTFPRADFRILHIENGTVSDVTAMVDDQLRGPDAFPIEKAERFEREARIWRETV